MPVQEEGELTPARATALRFHEHTGKKAKSHSQSMTAAGLVPEKSWNQTLQQHHSQTQQAAVGFGLHSEEKWWASSLSKL